MARKRDPGYNALSAGEDGHPTPRPARLSSVSFVAPLAAEIHGRPAGAEYDDYREHYGHALVDATSSGNHQEAKPSGSVTGHRNSLIRDDDSVVLVRQHRAQDQQPETDENRRSLSLVHGVTPLPSAPLRKGAIRDSSPTT